MTLSSIPVGLLLPVTMAACLSCAAFKNYYGKRISASPRGLHFYNLVSFAVTTLLLFLYAGCRPQGSLYTVMIGIAFGAVTALSSAFELAAMSIGPMSYTVVLISSSTVITALSGLFFGESISLLKWAGILLMMVCLGLSGLKKDGGEKKKASLKWLLYSVLAAFFAASVGLLQKIHQESPKGGELTLMLLVAFAFSTVLSLVLYLAAAKKHPPVLKRAEDGRLSVPAAALCLGILVAVGVCVMLNNVINLHLVGVMDSAVFFPLVGGGHLILTTLVGLLLFREKLPPLQWVGLISGILATFCLCF